MNPPDARPAYVEGHLRIKAAVLAEIEADARTRYPDESCGFVFGPAHDPPLLDAVQREDNEADRYHALDPVQFPRTARTYFKMNELRAARTFDAAARVGRPVKVIYHSHTDTGAHFSGEDASTFSRDGHLMWPCAFLVVSVVDARVSDRKLWVHVRGSDRFVESTLTVI